jgi:hypothetical protein
LTWIDKKFTYLSFEIENRIIFQIVPDFIKWNKPYNIIDFLEKLKLILLPYGFLVDFKNDDNFLENGFEISCKLNLDKKINEEYEKFLFIIDSEIKNIFENHNLIDVSSIIKKYGKHVNNI